MADGSGSIGLMGVIIGAVIVAVIGGAIFYSGALGNKSAAPGVTITLPKAK